MVDLGQAITDRIAEDYPKDDGRRTEGIRETIGRIQKQYPDMPHGTKPAEPFYVTPYLSPMALSAAKNHQMMAKQPVFVKAVMHDPMTYEYCKNCGGGGVTVLVLCERGPFKNPPSTGKSITWFDGDGINGPGWYMIERTLSYECPECTGDRK